MSLRTNGFKNQELKLFACRGLNDRLKLEAVMEQKETDSPVSPRSPAFTSSVCEPQSSSITKLKDMFFCRKQKICN